MKLNKLLGQVLWVLLITAVLLGVPRLGGMVADLFDYSTIDPDGAFMWLTVHHIVQALIILVLMVILSSVINIRFGFGWGDRKVGLLYVRIFLIVYGVYSLVSLGMIFFTKSFSIFPYPLTTRNILGQMGFQLMLTGPSEELIFRAFAITMLGLFIQGTLIGTEQTGAKNVSSILGGALTVPNLLAAVIFGIAHMRFKLVPFSVSYSTGQVIYSIILGLFYGVCYERSKSIVYPMIMHSITNVVAVGVSIIGGFVLL